MPGIPPATPASLRSVGRAGGAPAGQRVQQDRREQHGSGPDVLAGRAEPEQDDAVVDDGHDEAAEHGAQHPPRPPNRLTPPITAPATEYSTYWPPVTLFEVGPSRHANRRRVTPAIRPPSANAMTPIRF